MKKTIGIFFYTLIVSFFTVTAAFVYFAVRAHREINIDRKIGGDNYNHMMVSLIIMFVIGKAIKVIDYYREK